MDRVQEPLVVPQGELKEIPEKRHFFDLFRTIPKKIEREMNYELENPEREIPKFRGLFDRFLQKSFDLEDFMYELESQTFWRRKFRGDDNKR